MTLRAGLARLVLTPVFVCARSLERGEDVVRATESSKNDLEFGARENSRYTVGQIVYFLSANWTSGSVEFLSASLRKLSKINLQKKTLFLINNTMGVGGRGLEVAFSLGSLSIFFSFVHDNEDKMARNDF